MLTCRWQKRLITVVLENVDATTRVEVTSYKVVFFVVSTVYVWAARQMKTPTSCRKSWVFQKPSFSN